MIAGSGTAAALPVILLMGTTACGKTELAAELSSRLPAELISVDAAQVYRGMDIGTAKAEHEFLSRFPHHLIDIRDPDQVYSAAEFRHDALRLIDSIHARQRLPILVGGTLFYFAALEHGLSQLPAANAELRRQINQEISNYGLAQLYQQLIEFDPALADRIKASDSQRIQRALEIQRLTGKQPSALMLADQAMAFPHRLLKLGLFMPDRSHLHQRIGSRFKQMVAAGLVEEVRTLLAQHQLDPSMPSMRTVGYRQVLGYLKHEYDRAEMIERGIAATRQLAKRQLTWMRQQSSLVWLDANHTKRDRAAIQLASAFVALS